MVRCMNSFRTILFLALLPILLVSCLNDPLEPVAPTWDVDLTIPLANRGYSVMDVVNKEPSLVSSGQGTQIVYHNRIAAPGDSVRDAIALNPTPSVRSVKVGVFNLDQDSLSVDFVFPFLPPGSTLPGLPDRLIDIADVPDTIKTFTIATFESGTLSMTFQNNLRDTVVIENDLLLFDSTHLIATLSFANTRLAAGQSAVRSADLAGQTVSRIVRMSGISFHLLGKPGTVTIPTGPLLHSSISFTSLRAHSATVAHIPAQLLTDNDTTFLAINDSTILKDVLFRQGTLLLNFQSRVAVDLRLIYRFLEVRRPTGATYSGSLVLPRFGAEQDSIALPGVRIQSVTGDLVRSLEVISSLDLPAADNVTLHDTDKVIIAFSSPGKVIADSAVAVVKPTWVNINTSVALNTGDLGKKFSGQFQIPVASLNLMTISMLGFSIDTYLQINVKSPTSGQQIVLPIPQRRIQPGIPDSITIDVGNFLSSASPRLPDSIRISGSVLVNPPDLYNPTLSGAGSISGRSGIRDTVTIDIPLRLSLIGGVFRDTTSLDFKASDIEKMNTGTVYVEIQNSLPIRQDSVYFYLLDSTRTNRLLRLPKSGPPIAVAAATVDAQGNVAAPVMSTTSMTLDSDDIKALSRSKNLVYAVGIGTAAAGQVRVRTSDSFHIRLWSRLSYRVSK
jgi:hypothetical protein